MTDDILARLEAIEAALAHQDATLADLNEVGRVILDGNAFDEVLCFARRDGTYKLRQFYRLY